MAFPLYKCSLAIAAGQKVGTPSGIALVVTEDGLPSAIFDADGSTPAQNGGGDLRAYSDSSLSTQIPLDVVLFTTDNDPANGKAHLAVDFADLSSDTFWLAWGSDEGSKSQPAEGDTYGRHNVYDSDLRAYYTFVTNPAGSAPQLIDRTAQSHDGTTAGAMTLSDLVDGQIGKAYDFDGSNDRITLGQSSGFLLVNACTIRALVKTAKVNAQRMLTIYRAPGSSGITFCTGISNGGSDNADGKPNLCYRNSSNGFTVLRGPSAINNNAYRCLTGIISGANAYLRVDGSQVATSSDVSTANTFTFVTQQATVGNYQANDAGSGIDQSWLGLLDELQIYRRAISSDDDQTLYNCENNNAAFWDTGAVQNVSTGVGGTGQTGALTLVGYAQQSGTLVTYAQQSKSLVGYGQQSATLESP